MPARRSRSIAPYLPLFNISLPKLALAVILSALITMTLFIMENRRQLAQTPLASAVLTPSATISVIIPPNPVKKLLIRKYQTVEEIFAEQLTASQSAAKWSYKVNGQTPPVDASRFALHDADTLEFIPEK